jgi:lipid A 3-O-deacylase
MLPYSKMRSRLVAALFLLAPLGAEARAQDLEGFRFQVDNDWFDFWQRSVDRPDDNYTHGQVIRAVFDAAPRWVRFGHPDCSSARHTSATLTACIQAFATITQQIFTPTEDSPIPVPGARPYAGLLMGEFGAQLVKPRVLQAVGIRLGTTGRNSGAEAAQKAFHRWADLRRPQGWEYQVAAQPVVGIAYGSQYMLTPPRSGRRSAVTVAASGSAVATNLQSGMNGGLEIHAGHNAPHPWMPQSSAERRRFRAYAILGANESWVVRNLLIEGNSPYTTGFVAKKPLVFESVWGFAVGAGGYFIEYRAVSMSRDYETGPSWHRWGAISLIVGNP